MPDAARSISAASRAHCVSMEAKASPHSRPRAEASKPPSSVAPSICASRGEAGAVAALRYVSPQATSTSNSPPTSTPTSTPPCSVQAASKTPTPDSRHANAPRRPNANNTYAQAWAAPPSLSPSATARSASTRKTSPKSHAQKSRNPRALLLDSRETARPWIRATRVRGQNQLKGKLTGRIR